MKTRTLLQDSSFRADFGPKTMPFFSLIPLHGVMSDCDSSEFQGSIALSPQTQIRRLNQRHAGILEIALSPVDNRMVLKDSSFRADFPRKRAPSLSVLINIQETNPRSGVSIDGFDPTTSRSSAAVWKSIVFAYKCPRARVGALFSLSQT